MPDPFDDVPLVDGHAHPPLRPDMAPQQPFARYFTEAHDPETIARHAPHTLFYRHALRELATFLGCDTTEAAVVAARDAAVSDGVDAYLRRLLADAHVEAVVLDDG